MVSVPAIFRARAMKTEGGRLNLETQYAIEMLNITKRFPGIIANDNITLQLRLAGGRGRFFQTGIIF